MLAKFAFDTWWLTRKCRYDVLNTTTKLSLQDALCDSLLLWFPSPIAAGDAHNVVLAC